MSVINKMLRDLDARRVEEQLPDLQRPISPAALHGTASVTQGRTPRSRRRWMLLGGAALLVAVILWVLESSPPERSLVPAVVSAAPQVPQVPLAPPEPMPAQTATPSATAGALLPKAEARAPEPSSVPPAVKPLAREPVLRVEAWAAPPSPAVAPSKPQAPVSTLEVPVPASPPAATVGEPTLPVAAPKEAKPSAERRQGAVMETLAQAQGLWNAGSREAGLDLLRDAVAAVERVQPRDTELLARLVREQVRMELALGRPGNALALLTRLEPDLSQQADLWAVRGNAAQRLGRHAEAVLAYLAALQLRPGEPRWMLGAAVSLAAQGQLDAAAAQAEQARALGPVSSEVLSYLRQTGVPLR
ncbi:MAG: hypothetical protein ACK5RC_08235 [Curvibacter sp.]